MSPDWPFIKRRRGGHRKSLAGRGQGADEHLERLAGVHQPVGLGDVAERKLAVEHLARVDAAVEDPRDRRLKVGADRRRPASEGGVLAEQRREADGRVFILWDSDARDHPAGADDAVRPLVGGHVADGFQDHVRAFAG